MVECLEVKADAFANLGSAGLESVVLWKFSGAKHRVSKATTSAKPPLSIYNSTDANF